MVEYLLVFDEPASPGYALVLRLREVVAEKALRETEGDDGEGYLAFRRIPVFVAELEGRLGED